MLRCTEVTALASWRTAQIDLCTDHIDIHSAHGKVIHEMRFQIPTSYLTASRACSPWRVRQIHLSGHFQMSCLVGFASAENRVLQNDVVFLAATLYTGTF